MVGGCKKDIHRARWSNPRSPKQWCKDEPNRAQPKQGCLSLHPGVQLHLQVVDAHLQRSNPFSWLELFPESVSASLALSIIAQGQLSAGGLRNFEEGGRANRSSRCVRS